MTFFDILMTKLQQENIAFDAENSQVQCQAHVLNLATQEYLKKRDKNLIISKLRKLIVIVRSSPQ